MIEEELHTNPGYLIRRAYQHAWGIFTDYTKDLNITPVQHSVLAVIAEFPSIDASRVGEIITIDRATIGNVVQRLETRGLLMRTPDPSDARTKNLFLTPAGQEMTKKLAAQMPDIKDKTLEGLDPGERQELSRLLSKLIEIDKVKHNTANYRAAVNLFRLSLKTLSKAQREGVD